MINILNFYEAGKLRNPFGFNLVSYLKFNGDINDYKGNFWVISNGSTPTYEAGFFGQAGKLTNGAFRLVDISLGSINDNVQDLPFTFSLRFKWETKGTGDAWLLNKAYTVASGYEYRLCIGRTSQKPYLILNSLGSNTNFKRIDFDFAFNLDQWYNIIIAGDGTTVECYIDGNLVSSSVSVTGSYVRMQICNSYFGICNRGYVSPAVANQFIGLVDEFIFWKNRKLTEVECSNLFSINREIF